MSARSARLITILGGILGAILFYFSIRSAGVGDIADGIRRVGWGLLFILAAGGIRLFIRAECWRLCMGTPVGMTQALLAFVAGDAVGNVTPLGLLASEPTKVLLTRHHLATREAAASLALENLVYAASVVAMIGVGILALLVEIDIPAAWRWIGVVAIVAMAAGALVVSRLMQGTWEHSRGARPRWRERLSSMRLSVIGYSASNRSRLWRAFALDLLFHATAVVEIYVTLEWLVVATGVTWTQAIVFEALNRVITVAFKFVPFRIGVDEALSGALAPVLAIDPAAGVTLAVVRKIRNLFWSGVGLAIVAAHPSGTPAAPATDRRGSVSAHRS